MSPARRRRRQAVLARGSVRRPVFPLVVGLLVLGFGGTALRSWTIGYPLVPRVTQQVWSAHLDVTWSAGQAPVTTLLPSRSTGHELHDERFIAAPLDFTVHRDADGTRSVVWTGQGATTARYEAQFILDPAAPRPPPPRPDPAWRRLEAFPPDVQEAARRLATALGAPASPRACADLVGRGATSRADLADAASSLRAAAGPPALALVACWRATGWAARVVQAWPLVEGFFEHRELLAEVMTRGGRSLADPDRGRFPARPGQWLVWAAGAGPLVRAAAGPAPSWRMELVAERQTLWAQLFRQTAARGAFLTRWSLYAVPDEMQEVFQVLLVVPLGALVVAVLRNLVGVTTFGTFMPILIAIAFRQTSLLLGLALFLLVLLAGYLARAAIDRYKLLLVPRLATMLTFVILCLTLLSLAGVHLGQRQVLFVGLLPMVILTMAIERFHVVLEESGAREAVRTAGGTLAVAALTFGMISWEWLRLVFFTYPELLLAVAAGQVALGRYVGFRLTELRRFRRLAEPE